MPLVYTTLASDTFHRANENPLNPTVWSDDPAHVNSPLEIISNQACPVNAQGIGVYIGIAWPNNQWAEMEINACSDNNASDLLVMRRTDFHNAIAIEIDGPLGSGATFSFFEEVNEVATVWFSETMTVNPGDIIRMECLGNIITAKLNGVIVAVSPPALNASGNAAINLFYDTTPTDCQVSNFRGGSISNGADLIEGFAPNWYFGLENSGLGIWVAAGAINGTEYNGQLVLVPANATTSIGLNSQGQIVLGLGPSIYPVATIVTGQIVTSGSTKASASFITSNGVLSITDQRPMTPFSF